MNAYIKAIARFLLLLIVIQSVRALIAVGLWDFVGRELDLLDWAYVDMVAFSLIGMGLISFFQPSAKLLALDWKDASRWERINYVGGGLLTVGLFLSTYFLQPELFIANFSSVIVIPVFEEMLFRGWGWTQLDNAASFKHAGLINWLVISFLFGLWHFGYMDIYMLKVAPAWPEMQWGTFFPMKFITTLLIGLVIGLPRWRTGRVHGSVILHGLVNIFGR